MRSRTTSGGGSNVDNTTVDYNLRNIHNNARENITRTSAKRKELEFSEKIVPIY